MGPKELGDGGEGNFDYENFFYTIIIKQIMEKGKGPREI